MQDYTVTTQEKIERRMQHCREAIRTTNMPEYIKRMRVELDELKIKLASEVDTTC